MKLRPPATMFESIPPFPISQFIRRLQDMEREGCMWQANCATYECSECQHGSRFMIDVVRINKQMNKSLEE
jgi:hypothetical protein